MSAPFPTTPTSQDNAPPPATPPKRRTRLWILLSFLLLLIALLGGREDLRTTALASSKQAARYLTFELLGVSPREVFIWRLRLTGLAERPLGQRWITAVDRAEPQLLPKSKKLYTTRTFSDEQVIAHVYYLPLKQGEQLLWQLSHPASSDQLYASLERQTSSGTWSMVAQLTPSDIEHRLLIRHSGDYRLVLQPELFASINYSLAVAYGGSLPFPVKGGSQHDIGGGFGVARDGGARAHHGVDIFANKGTPVTAVVDGKVRIGTGGLGGNYLWLSDNKLGLGGARYYYAHLDGFAVTSGDSVTQGDTLGYVGNTGNAKHTPPHLHFGVYARGPVDPAPYLTAKPVLPTR